MIVNRELASFAHNWCHQRCSGVSPWDSCKEWAGFTQDWWVSHGSWKDIWRSGRLPQSCPNGTGHLQGNNSLQFGSKSQFIEVRRPSRLTKVKVTFAELNSSPYLLPISPLPAEIKNLVHNVYIVGSSTFLGTCSWTVIWHLILLILKVSAYVSDASRTVELLQKVPIVPDWAVLSRHS